MEKNYSIYTLENIRIYSYRLHVNTSLSATLNALTAYLVSKHSTKAMGKYKYFILATVVFVFLLDFQIIFIFGLFPLFPRAIMCPAGIARYLGPFWGMTMQYIFAHFLMTFSGFSLFFAAAYQYFSVTGKENIFHKTWGIVLTFIIPIAYVTPLIILYIPNIDYENLKANVKLEAPDIYDFFIAANCNGSVLNEKATIYLAFCILEVIILHCIGISMLFKIIAKLNSMKSSFSDATLKLQKQFLRSIAIQYTMPFAAILFPVSFLMGSIIIGKGNIEELNKWMIQIVGLHSSANALTVMIFITPYRKSIINGFRTIKRYIFRQSSPIVKINPSNSQTIASVVAMNH